MHDKLNAAPKTSEHFSELRCPVVHNIYDVLSGKDRLRFCNCGFQRIFRVTRFVVLIFLRLWMISVLVSVKIIRFNKPDYLIGQLFQRIQKFIRRKPEIAVRRFRIGK